MSYYWTHTEEAYMHDHYGRQTSAQIAAHLGRTKLAVRLKARALGLADQARWAPKSQGQVLTGPNVIVHRAR